MQVCKDWGGRGGKRLVMEWLNRDSLQDGKKRVVGGVERAGLVLG